MPNTEKQPDEASLRFDEARKTIGGLFPTLPFLARLKMHVDDRWLVARITALIAVPFSLLFTWAYMYGGREKTLVLAVCIVGTLAGSFLIAITVWFFLVRPNREAAEWLIRPLGGTSQTLERNHQVVRRN